MATDRQTRLLLAEWMKAEVGLHAAENALKNFQRLQANPSTKPLDAYITLAYDGTREMTTIQTELFAGILELIINNHRDRLRLIKSLATSIGMDEIK